MTSTDELIAAIERVGEAYAAWVETLSEEQFRRRPDPNEWTAAEITGHVSEAPSTFANHARRLATEGGGKAGRPPSDPNRLAAVKRLADRGPQEGAQLVREGVAEACTVLRTIEPSGWDVLGDHLRLGKLSVRGLVESSILDHLRGHLEQAKAAAGA
ncbi:MAG: DinB family protein [Chloroflexota bacterium]